MSQRTMAIFLDGKIVRIERDGELLFKAFGFDHFIKWCEVEGHKRNDFGNWPWWDHKTPTAFRKTS